MGSRLYSVDLYSAVRDTERETRAVGAEEQARTVALRGLGLPASVIGFAALRSFPRPGAHSLLTLLAPSGEAAA
jgi:hypothetical protein